MKISELIEKLQKEKRKYGDLPVILHVANEYGMMYTFKPAVDVATFNDQNKRTVWISSEEAE